MRMFVDKKLSIHFDEDKLNAFFLASQKYLPQLNITYNNNRTNQFHLEEYLGCFLDASLNGEVIAMAALKKINAKLQFLYTKLSF